jgi:hypothetical protein
MQRQKGKLKQQDAMDTSDLVDECLEKLRTVVGASFWGRPRRIDMLTFQQQIAVVVLDMVNTLSSLERVRQLEEIEEGGKKPAIPSPPDSTFHIFESLDGMPIAIDLKQVVSVKSDKRGNIELIAEDTSFYVTADFLETAQRIRKAKKGE